MPLNSSMDFSNSKKSTQDYKLGLTLRLFVYLSYGILIFMGHLHDIIDALKGKKSLVKVKGYAPLTSDFEAFFTRRLYARAEDCWNRPISETPGAWINVIERICKDKTWKTDLTCTDRLIHCLNLASYNYLGFASNKGPIIEDTIKCLYQYGISSCSPRIELGTNMIHRMAEKEVAQFVGKEDAMIFGMGYGTNSTTIPALFQRGDLIISDSMNHASLIYGCRASDASIKVFRHNDPQDLEELLRKVIPEGQPRFNRPWKRILVLVEGIYSMEGKICRLPEFIQLKKKYKFYLYIDEAHSIGALGSNARGVCDYFDIAPDQVDILMGTFTKSFASVGGYIAADKKVIDYLRSTSYGQIYDNSMTPCAMQQALSALRCINGQDGTTIGAEKIQQLRENSNFFRHALIDRGFEVMGDEDSPVVPVMCYFPAKLPAISRECLKEKMAVVVVGFPATQLVESRIRFCISASHTIEELKWAIDKLDKIGDRLLIKYAKNAATKLS